MSIEEQVKAIVEEQVGLNPGNFDKIERASVIAVLEWGELMRRIDEAQEMVYKLDAGDFGFFVADLMQNPRLDGEYSAARTAISKRVEDIFKETVTTYARKAMEEFGDDLTPHPIERIDAMEGGE